MNKKYDLEDRTFDFANGVFDFINNLNKTLVNVEIAKQVIRSAGSIGANYIEANKALSKKDFIYRIKLCRKEAKESTYWIKLLHCDSGTEKKKKGACSGVHRIDKHFRSHISKFG